MSSSSDAALEQQPAGDAARARLLHQLLVERIDRVRRLGELQVLFLHLGQHPAVLRGRLRGLGDDAQEIERAAAALPFRVQGGLRSSIRAVPARPLSVSSCSSRAAVCGMITGNRKAGFHGRKELGLFLDDLREAFFYEAVQNLVDLLPRHVRARGQFQRFEFGMTEQHQIRPGFVRIQPELLQPSPEPLKIDLGQFFAHRFIVIRAQQRNPYETSLLACPGDAQVGEMASGAIASPQAHRSARAVAQFFDGETGGSGAVHEKPSHSATPPQPGRETTHRRPARALWPSRTDRDVATAAPARATSDGKRTARRDCGAPDPWRGS